MRERVNDRIRFGKNLRCETCSALHRECCPRCTVARMKWTLPLNLNYALLFQVLRQTAAELGLEQVTDAQLQEGLKRHVDALMTGTMTAEEFFDHAAGLPQF